MVSDLMTIRVIRFNQQATALIIGIYEDQDLYTIIQRNLGEFGGLFQSNKQSDN